MNGRKSKALKRAAERLSKEPTGHQAIDRSFFISPEKAFKLGLRKKITKTPFKVFRYQLVCTGVRRMYQDLKKAYYAGVVR